MRIWLVQTKAPQTPVRVTGRSSNSPPPKTAQLQLHEWLLRATWRHCWANRRGASRYRTRSSANPLHSGRKKCKFPRVPITEKQDWRTGEPIRRRSRHRQSCQHQTAAGILGHAQYRNLPKHSGGPSNTAIMVRRQERPASSYARGRHLPYYQPMSLRRSYNRKHMSRMLCVLCSILVAVPLLSLAQATAPNEKVPVMEGGAGPCSIELTVLGADGKAVYGATVKVHIKYGFGGIRRLDLEAGTNSDGKVRFAGLPARVQRPPLEFRASKDEFTGIAAFDPSTECQARHDITLEKPKAPDGH